MLYPTQYLTHTEHSVWACYNSTFEYLKKVDQSLQLMGLYRISDMQQIHMKTLKEFHIIVLSLCSFPGKKIDIG